MAITATAGITVAVSGAPEGGSNSISVTASNTSAVGTIAQVSLTTVNGTATGVVVPSSGAFLMALPPSGADPYRMTNSTAEVGISLSTRTGTLINVVGGSTVYFYVAAGGAPFSLRVLVY